MTSNSVSEVLKELKRQLRHIDRAIAALEAIEQVDPKRNHKKHRTRIEKRNVVEKKNGTTGEVVPFIRPN